MLAPPSKQYSVHSHPNQSIIQAY